MKLFALEHSRAAYQLDYALYGSAVVVLAAILVVAAPRGGLWQIVVLAGSGVAGWTLIEYVLHRFVLHGLPPFRNWHAEHHDRPNALICTPTVLSASLIGACVYLPLLVIGDWWHACTLTLGFVIGYLVYAIIHHCIHHGAGTSGWILSRRRWHGQHHRRTGAGCCYGVTTACWDRLFGTADVDRSRSARALEPIERTASPEGTGEARK